ncbi:MAG: phosphodiester glycosidase family protein [Balneolaceae bacterium]
MKKSVLLSILTCLLFNSFVLAQAITWTEKTETVQLPDGIRFFEGIRVSPALKGWYFEVDLNNADIALVPYLAENGTESISNFASRENVFAAINGGYFGGGISYSTLVHPGEVLAQNVPALTRSSNSYPVIRSMFGIKKDRSMSVDWIYHFGGGIDNLYQFDSPMPYTSSNDNPLPAPTKESGELYSDAFLGVGGGPVLVKGDSSKVTYNEEIFWGSGVGLSNSDPRTAAGYTNDGKAILMVIDGRQGSVSVGVSLTELAEIMISLGATEAINLDGGGSSQMVIGDSLINRPSGSTLQRSVATFLAVVPVDSIPKISSVGFEQIIDTGDALAEVSSGWAESANAGYYGNTPSLLTLGGDGSKSVTFSPDLPESNLYELYGWWVSSSNRSKKSAFIIQHEQGIDTVYADQSTDNSQWVKLGEFPFSGTNSDKVIISNIGGDVNNYVVADAIRFVGIEKQMTNNEFETQKEAFELYPAYPNPFNPSTNISYQLPASGQVKVEVFNINGQLIKTLFNGRQGSGNYQHTWDATNISSGVYFVKVDLQTSSDLFTQVQRITLIK